MLMFSATPQHFNVVLYFLRSKLKTKKKKILFTRYEWEVHKHTTLFLLWMHRALTKFRQEVLMFGSLVPTMFFQSAWCLSPLDASMNPLVSVPSFPPFCSSQEIVLWYLFLLCEIYEPSTYKFFFWESISMNSLIYLDICHHLYV